MRTYFFPSLLLTLFLCTCDRAQDTGTAEAEAPVATRAVDNFDYPLHGSVDRMDARLDRVIKPGQQLQKLASGFDWIEGPVWVPEEGGYLLFSDIPENRIYKWAGGDSVTVYLEPSGYTGDYSSSREPGSNGLVLDPTDGSLVLCQHGDRRVSRMTASKSAPAAEFETLASNYGDKRLNSPNDAVFAANGDLYFTDPPYGLAGTFKSTSKELDFQGVYHLERKTGKVTLLDKSMRSPNGITLTPDGKTLIVASSAVEFPKWLKYPVNADGSVGERSVFYDATPFLPRGTGRPDGMAMHSSGHLFASGPNGIYVFHPDETLLGIVETGERTANCTLDAEEEFLYITADSIVFRLPLLEL